MIAITYAADNSITVYREGELYGTYTKGSLMGYGAGSMVVIGPRHANHADVFDGFVNEARMYNYALGADEIQQLHQWGPDVIPEPGSAALLAAGAIFGLAVFVRRRRARVEDQLQ